MTVPGDPRYPIGPFKPEAEDSPFVRKAQIGAIRLLPSQLREAVVGLNEAQLDEPYRAGGWSVRQVVHHLGDSHAISFTRFKFALTEDWPAIKPYDEAAWALLPDSLLPVEPSLNFIEALHTRWVALLESMGEIEFNRGFAHPENGRLTLAAALAIYAWHGRHHVAHISGLRQRQGW